MAISRSQTSAADLALLAADVPCILAQHGLRDAESAFEIANWQDGVTPSAGSDETQHGAPVSRAYDGWAHHGLHTWPEVADLPVLALDFRVAAADAYDVDTIVVFGSNLAGADSLGCRLWDENGFLFGYVINTAFPSGDRVRYPLLGLGDASSGGSNTLYSGVPAVRLTFAATVAFQPRVRELWLGKRIQLPFEPNRPYGHRREASGVEEHVAHGGARTGAAHVRGRAERRLEFDLSIAAHRTTIRRFWDETDGGTESFLWIETPSSDPTPYLMKLRDTTYDPVLHGGAVNRAVTFDFVEQSPLVAVDP